MRLKPLVVGAAIILGVGSISSNVETLIKNYRSGYVSEKSEEGLYKKVFCENEIIFRNDDGTYWTEEDIYNDAQENILAQIENCRG